MELNEAQDTTETTVLDENIEQLGYKLYDVTEGELYDIAPSLGYTNLNKGTTYDDGTKGVLVRMSDGEDTYNNGIYMLRRLEGNELVLEVIVQNTRDKGSLIQNMVQSISNHITGLDTLNMTVFDYAETFGYVIANTVVKPLADSLFPKDKEKQDRFVMLYMPRLMAQIAYIYSGDATTFEEGVNSEPFVLKQMIDNNTPTMDEAQETASEKDDTDETI